MLEELFFHEMVPRVIEHFVIHEKWGQNKKDMCEILEINTELMDEILEKLIEFNLIQTVKIGEWYKINKRSKILPFLRGLVLEFGLYQALAYAKKQINLGDDN